MQVLHGSRCCPSIAFSGYTYDYTLAAVFGRSLVHTLRAKQLVRLSKACFLNSHGLPPMTGGQEIAGSNAVASILVNSTECWI